MGFVYGIFRVFLVRFYAFWRFPCEILSFLLHNFLTRFTCEIPCFLAGVMRRPQEISHVSAFWPL